MKKQRAAPAIALLQERMAPCHQPKIAALENVIRKAGRGATTEENTINAKETAIA